MVKVHQLAIISEFNLSHLEAIAPTARQIVDGLCLICCHGVHILLTEGLMSLHNVRIARKKLHFQGANGQQFVNFELEPTEKLSCCLGRL